jgi:integrase
MARKINRLNARAVTGISKRGRHADGGGLYLSISPNGGRRWVFLFRWQGKPTEIGFGSARDVTEEVAAFISDLREREASAALALELCILTAARSGEILRMSWVEVDLDKKIWTVPASRMKAGREHRVPLAPRAIAILTKLDERKTSQFVFNGQTRNKSLSDMAMEMVLRRENATVHGFRSSFRDWAGNVSNFPREIV